MRSLTRSQLVRAVAHVYLDRLDDVDRRRGGRRAPPPRVLRVRDGEVVTAADGHGRWRAYEVVPAGRRPGACRSRGDHRALAHEPRLTPGLTVACALTKGERPELVVQKLTELGVDGVVLVRAARSVVRWDDARAASALARLGARRARGGAQCRRARLPVLDGPVARRRARRAPRPRRRRAPTAWRRPSCPWPPGGAWTVAVGPEGGFDDDELAVLGRRAPARARPARAPGRDRRHRGGRGRWRPGGSCRPTRRDPNAKSEIDERHRLVLCARSLAEGARRSMDGRYVGERLRAIRRQKGLSLHDVEARSDQEFKASVLGAYERGERAISVPRLLRLAELYRVPADQLLPRAAPGRRHRPHRRGARLRPTASPSTSCACTRSTTTTPR